MKYFRSLPAIALAGSLFIFGCESKSADNNSKITELEEKIAELEKKQVNLPSNTQSVQPADPTSLGAFEFEEMEHSFGTITEGEVIEHVFNFTNTGQAPLVISNINASCGCTSPDWTKTPIKPGEAGYVKVVFNSTAKVGTQAPTVSINANTSPNVTRLRLKGVVNKKSGESGPNLGPVKK
ncbi:DUF1573 domain-containing protein [Pararhodonellum marinum]|uniref:DUF1573 domain-containing protein n=1 Tax=Pararhodonellum marinum TaxID=2755358 RepID=UPI00188DFB60|nr:DUF1573 domain-containing protein [Pararhodonellum marinum]